MEGTPATDTIPVVVWMNDIDHVEIENDATAYRFELVDSTIALASPMEYATTAEMVRSFTATPVIELNEADIRQVTNDYIAYERKAHETAYTAVNQEKLNLIFPKTKMTLFRTIETDQPEVTYVSMYSPIILMELTAEQIFQACESEYVTGIYYDGSSESGDFDQVSFAKETTGTAELLENRGLDGTGIKIGMIEDGVPKPDSNYFYTNKITYDETLLDSNGELNQGYVTAHASAVASILVGKNDGIVPNAELYCTRRLRSGGWYAGIEWLLSKSVNIINISNKLMGTSADGYGSTSVWMDHIALQHSVHIVTSSGNSGEDMMTEPKYAYNIITVGAVERDGTLAEYSAYSSTCYKPDLCAPGTVNVQYGMGVLLNNSSDVRADVSGTSFSAPIVTAAVAQICQSNSTLLVCQDALKSILLAGTASPGAISSVGTLNNIAMERGVGAGVLDASNSYYVMNYARWRNLSFAATSGIGQTYTTTFTVSSSDTFIRVALAWLNTARLSNDTAHASQQTPETYTLENLQLSVIGPDGTYWTSYEETGNVQVIAFDPRKTGGTGTYTIRITRRTDYDSKIYFGLAWY